MKAPELPTEVRISGGGDGVPKKDRGGTPPAVTSVVGMRVDVVCGCGGGEGVGEP